MSTGILIDTMLDRIVAEAQFGHEKYGLPSSTHESLGVLLEEFDELKDAVHANDGLQIEREAIQVAAVAYRLAMAIACRNRAFLDRSGLVL